MKTTHREWLQRHGFKLAGTITYDPATENLCLTEAEENALTINSFCYAMVEDGVITKIGSSSRTLKNRFASFQTGNDKYAGADNAVTNRRFFTHVRDDGVTVEWWVIPCGSEEVSVTVGGKVITFCVEKIGGVERYLGDDFKNAFGHKPHPKARFPSVQYCVS